MSLCGELVLAIHEAKKEAAEEFSENSINDIEQLEELGGFSENRVKDLEHLAASMFSVLSFSHWGVGQKNGNEHISGLLLYPKIIYRLSIWKPTETFRFEVQNRIDNRPSDDGVSIRNVSAEI
jgi:hypothetical protein